MTYVRYRVLSDKLLPIPTHIRNNPSHSFNFNDVKILDRECNIRKRLISESIFINMTQNTINKQEDSYVMNKHYLVLNRVFNK